MTLSVLYGAVQRRAAVVYSLLDRFTTAASAPLTSPRTCVPGPGTLTIIDASNIISISGGQLVVNGSAAAASGVTSPSSFARQCGRALLITLPTRTAVNNSHRFGWALAGLADTLLAIGLDYNNSSSIRVKDGVAAIYTQAGVGTGTQFLACIMRGSGGWLLIRNSTQTIWTLLWVYNATSTSPTAAEFVKCYIAAGSAPNYTVDDLRVTDLGAPWTTDFGPATNHLTSASAGTATTATADALIETTFTMPTTATYWLDVRRVDSSNFVRVTMDTAGPLTVVQVVAGAATTQATTASVFSTATYRVVVAVVGNVYTVFVGNVQKATWTDAGNVNLTATGVQVEATTGSTSITDLTAWPRTIQLPTGV